jgi:hypothetical protein
LSRLFREGYCDACDDDSEGKTWRGELECYIMVVYIYIYIYIIIKSIFKAKAILSILLF